MLAPLALETGGADVLLNEESLAAKARHQQRPAGVDPAQLANQDVRRDKLALRRQHQSQNHAVQPEPATGKANAAKLYATTADDMTLAAVATLA
jgi:hypothetical protein